MDLKNILTYKVHYEKKENDIAMPVCEIIMTKGTKKSILEIATLS
jgi:hypothetical protein